MARYDWPPCEEVEATIATAEEVAGPPILRCGVSPFDECNFFMQGWTRPSQALQ